jgi:hypothetical protein
VCRLSLVDVPNYRTIKKRWKKGVVVSDKMDKSVAVLVDRCVLTYGPTLAECPRCGEPRGGLTHLWRAATGYVAVQLGHRLEWQAHQAQDEVHRARRARVLCDRCASHPTPTRAYVRALGGGGPSNGCTAGGWAAVGCRRGGALAQAAVLLRRRGC